MKNKKDKACGNMHSLMKLNFGMTNGHIPEKISMHNPREECTWPAQWNVPVISAN